MHPLGMLLAISTTDRGPEWLDDDERYRSLVRADASSTNEPISQASARPAPSRIRRLSANLGLVIRRLVASSVVALLVAALASPVAGASRDGGCGRRFTWIAIPDLLALRPNLPPALAAGIDGNGNGALCYFPLPSTIAPNSPEFDHLNLVDDRSPAA